MSALLLGAFTLNVCASEKIRGEEPIRSGLWVMQKLPADGPGLEEFSRKIHQTSHIAGVCLHIPWKDIERQSGKPDFSTLDKTLEVLRKLGMKYQLCLKPGVSTPAFVFDEGAEPFVTQITNPHRANVGESVKIPVPWDPIYQKDFSSIITALGQRYSSDPSCVSVVLTCANYLSAEMHLPRTGSDLTRWSALGNPGAKLLQVYQKFTDAWAEAFPKQEVSLHVSKVLDLPPEFNGQIIDYGLKQYPRRFTIQSCQLTGRREDTGVMTYELVQKYRDRAHHGFQSLAGLSHPNPRMGSIEMAVLNAVHAKAEYWELWTGDGLNEETATAIAVAWDEAKRIGYDAYKQKLRAAGKYRS